MQATLILILCAGTAIAGVGIEYQKPFGKPPACYDKTEGKKKIGETWLDPEHCGSKHCLSDSQGNILIRHIGCGSVVVEGDKKCRVVIPEGNLTYPDCCPQPVCD